MLGSTRLHLPNIKVAIEEFAKLFETETSGGSGTIECVVLNACESEGVGKRLRIYGVPHVVCWRSEVRDVTAMRFSATFYKALDCQSDGVRDYKRAFEQAAQPARMRSSEPTSSQARKPAKHQAPGAVDFICLLSKDGDVFPEPPKEKTKRLQSAAASLSAELIYPTMSGALSVENAREDVPIGEKFASAGPNKMESESSH